MNKAGLSHHKEHKPPQSRIGARPRVGLAPRPRLRETVLADTVMADPVMTDTVADGAERGSGTPCKRRSHDWSFPSVRESLNWSLRRYVPASSLRVWLRRQAPETGRTAVPAGRGGPGDSQCDSPSRAVAVRVGTVRETGSPVPHGRAHGVSLSLDHALRYRIHRNRQMEHFTQVARSLRGGVRRAASITARERDAASDLGSTT